MHLALRDRSFQTYQHATVLSNEHIYSFAADHPLFFTSGAAQADDPGSKPPIVCADVNLQLHSMRRIIGVRREWQRHPSDCSTVRALPTSILLTAIEILIALLSFHVLMRLGRSKKSVLPRNFKLKVNHHISNHDTDRYTVEAP